MGTDKALLSFGGKTLLEYVIDRVRQGIGGGQIVVVASPYQELPPPEVFGEDVEILRDAEAFAGPVAGLARAFAWLEDSVPGCWAFVSGCDTPGLKPGLVRYLGANRPQDKDVVLPEVGGYGQPLSACYQVRKCIALLNKMETKNSSLRSFTAQLDVWAIPERDIRKWDSQLQSFWNCHLPEDWEKWVALQGGPEQIGGAFRPGSSQT